MRIGGLSETGLAQLGQLLPVVYSIVVMPQTILLISSGAVSQMGGGLYVW